MHNVVSIYVFKCEYDEEEGEDISTEIHNYIILKEDLPLEANIIMACTHGDSGGTKATLKLSMLNPRIPVLEDLANKRNVKIFDSADKFILFHGCISIQL